MENGNAFENGQGVNGDDNAVSIPSAATSSKTSAWIRPRPVQSKDVTQTFVLAPTERANKVKSFGNTSEEHKKVNAIARETGCRIELAESKDGSLTVIIKGLRSKAEDAKNRVVRELQTQASANVDIPFLSERESKLATEHIVCPRVFYPFVLGPFNETYDKLVADTGAKINIPPSHVSNEVISITGPKEGVHRAAAVIRAIVADKEATAKSVTCQVAKSQHRYIVGQHREGLHKILRDTCVSVEVPNEEENSDTITLHGDPAQLGDALVFVYTTAGSGNVASSSSQPEECGFTYNVAVSELEDKLGQRQRVEDLNLEEHRSVPLIYNLVQALVSECVREAKAVVVETDLFSFVKTQSLIGGEEFYERDMIRPYGEYHVILSVGKEIHEDCIFSQDKVFDEDEDEYDEDEKKESPDGEVHDREVACFPNYKGWTDSYKMTLSRSEVAHNVRDTLKYVQIGKTHDEVENGRAFYKYFFTNFPDLRKYFKGAENYTADDVQKSERFEKQGQRILLAMYILANTFEDEPTFRAYAREQVNRHRQFKMEPSLWSAFFTVYVGFLESRGKLTDAQKAAWAQMGAEFNEECQLHLTDLGLPHC